MVEVQANELSKEERNRKNQQKSNTGTIIKIGGIVVLSWIGINIIRRLLQSNDESCDEVLDPDDEKENKFMNVIPISVLNQFAQEYYRGIGAKMEGKDLVALYTSASGKSVNSVRLRPHDEDAGYDTITGCMVNQPGFAIYLGEKVDEYLRQAKNQ